MQKKIRAFLEDFVTHMEQEEAVFQPLLDQNFEPQELKQMNEKVVQSPLGFACDQPPSGGLRSLKPAKPLKQAFGYTQPWI